MAKFVRYVAKGKRDLKGYLLLGHMLNFNFTEANKMIKPLSEQFLSCFSNNYSRSVQHNDRSLENSN